MTRAPKITHLDASGHPRMVDVGAKRASRRSAVAEARVHFPLAVAAALRANGLRAAKGPVLDTAIIAGTLAVKRTHELIPFCHSLAIERCVISAEFVGAADLVIRCEVAVTHKTGVEMEALVGATVAALTVYDMCKALSHAIVIGPVHLLDKAGGKRRISAGREQRR